MIIFNIFGKKIKKITMKKFLSYYSLPIAFLLTACGPSIEEQIKLKKEELKIQTDKYTDLHFEFTDASKDYSDAMEYYYDLQITGLAKDDNECIEAKNEADEFKKIEDSLQSLIKELEEHKLNVLQKQIDSLEKLK